MEFSYNTSQLFSYYPKYEYLDRVISTTAKKKLKLYIDFKSCGQALFQEWAVRHLINNSRDSRLADTSLFFSVLNFISFHKQYAKKRNLDLKIYFFMESGKSSYHKEIYPDYKKGRGIGEFFGLDIESKELFFSVLDKNYHVISKVADKLPDVSFIRLNYLEADFVPYYLMNYVLDKEDVASSCNVIYSSDKDLCQCLETPNVYQYFKHYKTIEMIDQNHVFTHWIKEDINIEDRPKWLPLALSIVGDSGDDIPGVYGIGNKRLIKVFPQIMTLVGNSMDKVYENILAKKPIFDRSYFVGTPEIQKILENEKDIVRNMKLISFKLLCEALEGGYPTDMIEKKKQIYESVGNTYKVTSSGVLFEALQKTGLFGEIDDKTLTGLF